MSAHLSALFGWVTCAILIAAFGVRLFPSTVRPEPVEGPFQAPRRRALLALALFLIALVPLGNHPGLAAGLHGLFGPPSITLFQLALLTVLGRPWPDLPNRRLSILWVLGFGVFYALSLGAFRTLLPDPYAWGFHPQWLCAPLLLLGWVLYRRGQNGWLMLLTINLVIWASGLPASQNLWDSLFDPLLVVIIGIRGWRTQGSRSP